MHRFKNILFLVDPDADNQSALDRAMALTEKNGAQLTAITVIDRHPEGVHPTAEVMALCDVQELVIQGAREQLTRLIGEGIRDEVHVGARILTGTPFLEIVRVVLREQHDLVITTTGPYGSKHKFFGSTVLHLMRKCPCPVWAIKPGQSTGLSRILAAVDTDPDTLDETRDALNKKIMDLAFSLAEREQSQLHIAHAWTMFGESALRGPRARVRPEEVDEWVCEDKERHKRLLDTLLAEYALGPLDHRMHLMKGKPGTVIPELAHKEQIDLIVMGSVCRTGIEGLLVGNTAERILLQVSCSVLTAKPDRFRSPVKLEAS